jgi:hypothetical protein
VLIKKGILSATFALSLCPISASSQLVIAPDSRQYNLASTFHLGVEQRDYSESGPAVTEVVQPPARLSSLATSDTSSTTKVTVLADYSGLAAGGRSSAGAQAERVISFFVRGGEFSERIVVGVNFSFIAFVDTGTPPGSLGPTGWRTSWTFTAPGGSYIGGQYAGGESSGIFTTDRLDLWTNTVYSVGVVTNTVVTPFQSSNNQPRSSLVNSYLHIEYLGLFQTDSQFQAVSAGIPGASTSLDYELILSPGVANAPITAVPEPPVPMLMLFGVAILLLARAFSVQKRLEIPAGAF